jgi:Fe-S-cluster containining protein
VDEVEKIAALRGMSPDEFGRKYVRRVGLRYSLIEDARNRCVMLGDDDRCTVYAARPSQCCTFPFWTSAMKTEKTWNALKEFCPGVDTGPVHSIDEIRATVQRV